MTEIAINDENEFEYRGRFLKMRLYNDGVWELLNEEGLPEVQGRLDISKLVRVTK